MISDYTNWEDLMRNLRAFLKTRIKMSTKAILAPALFFGMVVTGGVILPGSAEAAGWYTCDVHRIGPGWGNVYVTLSCGSAISPRWFIAGSDQAKEILATGLTAMSITKKVVVYLTGTAAYSEISAFYVTE